MRLLPFLFCFLTYAYAQEVLDTDFGNAGKLELSYHDYHEVEQMKVLSNGDVLILANAGRITGDGFNNDIMLTKIGQDGVIDTDFGTSGYFVSDFAGYESSLGKDFLELPSGNIAVLGHGFNFSETNIRPVLLMLITPDGQLISGFGVGGVLEISFLGESNTAYGLHLDAEGRILISAGSSDPIDNSGSVAVLARLTTGFELDLSFGGTGKIEVDPNQGVKNISNAKVTHASSTAFEDVITAVDGSVYAIGSTYNFYLVSYIVKLKENGDLDSSFYDNGIYAWQPTPIINNNARKIQQLSSGALLVIVKTDATNNNFTFLVIENDQVSAFSYDVNGQQDFLEQVIEDESGNLFLIGRSVDNDKYNSASYAHHYSIIKLNADFSVDEHYAQNGRYVFEWDGINQAGANEAILTNTQGLMLVGEVYETGLTGVNVGVVKIKEGDVTGISSFQEENEVAVYPNPFSDYLTINSREQEIERAFISDQWGRTVLSIDFIGTELDLSDLTQGLYFLHLETPNGTITKKITKQR